MNVIKKCDRRSLCTTSWWSNRYWTWRPAVFYSSYSVPININNSVSYRNQAWIGANLHFQESYETSIITLLNVNSTIGISPTEGGAFHYNLDHPALSYDTASSIAFKGCMFSSDWFSGGSIAMNNVRSLNLGDSQIFGSMSVYCVNRGAFWFTYDSFQTVNCSGGIFSDECNVSVLRARHM